MQPQEIRKQLSCVWLVVLWDNTEMRVFFSDPRHFVPNWNKKMMVEIVLLIIMIMTMIMIMIMKTKIKMITMIMMVIMTRVIGRVISNWLCAEPIRNSANNKRSYSMIKKEWQTSDTQFVGLIMWFKYAYVLSSSVVFYSVDHNENYWFYR